MDGWPAYWERMIPMHYATHVVSPCLGMVGGLAEYVSCFGSGTVRDDIAAKSGNRFAVETCHIKGCWSKRLTLGCVISRHGFISSLVLS